MRTRNNQEQQPREDSVMPTSNHRAGRAIAITALLPAMLFAISPRSTSAREYLAQAEPMSTPQSQPDKPASTVAAKVKRASVDRVEARITDLHDKLRVTADQEVLWNDLAQVMRENEKEIRDSIAARSAKLKTMNAVNDLKSYQMITDEHADGLKRLIPAFEALYVKMTPAQQKNADQVFDNQQHHGKGKS